MASAGPNSPSAHDTDDTYGSGTWSSPDEIYSEDGNVAYVDFNNPTCVLVAKDFGFSIPSGATIDGIKVEFKKSSYSGTCYDQHVSLVKAGSPQFSTNYANATGWPTSLEYVTYGGASDLWGDTWTDTDINASGFGACINATLGFLDGVQIDHVRITVYYTEGGGASAVPVIMNSYRQRRA